MISKEKLACIKAYESGLAFYREKKFKEALEKFKSALEYDPNDGPSKLFIERCELFMNTTLPDDWDGVFEMKTK